MPEAASVPVAFPTIVASVVAMHDARQYKDGGKAGYGSGDPSALAYVPELDILFVADAEHDESPYFSPTNLFAIRTDGTFVRSYSLAAFTSEPDGLTYNPANGFLYISDDNLNQVFWVVPSNPSEKIGQFDTGAYGLTDTEDLRVDTETGNLFILDGAARTLFEFTAEGALVGSLPLPAVMTDAEALAYDPVHGVFFVASGASPTIWALARNGEIRATIDVLDAFTVRNWTLSTAGQPSLASLQRLLSGSPPMIKGLELAPSSNPNDGETVSLFVADAGVDQRHDGRIIEISLGPGWARDNSGRGTIVSGNPGSPIESGVIPSAGGMIESLVALTMLGLLTAALLLRGGGRWRP